MAIVFDCNSNVIVITDCMWNATGPTPSFVNNVEVKLNSDAMCIKIKLIEQRT